MNIRVEGTEEFGNEVYAELFERILVDLGLTNRVEVARLVVKPEVPLFLVSIRTRRARTAVKISDISTVEQRQRDTYMMIGDESYAPALLALLWKRFGRERIEQITRLEVLVHGIKQEELEDLELDPGQELKKEVLDAVWRLLPEGFKVRHNILSESVMTVAATEHVMQPEYISLAEKVHREMETAPEEQEEVVEDV
ncbi:MAG: methanogenesis marker 17 protein [Methanomassiliicoccales archaeon]|jgi:putative methanogenesis marker protein 17|nr:methanogenesis marker 17 protein [Methanomassiliicoccales archaeon]